MPEPESESQGLFVEQGELREVLAHRAALNETFVDLGWREQSRRELEALMNNLSAQATEQQREFTKATNRIFGKYQTPQGTKLNFATGELIVPTDPRYDSLK